ncbi:MAG: histidine kinase [Lachnospiraceae bacterium]|nr:histidine kinase [Lachnospiraceae bacterium]
MIRMEIALFLVLVFIGIVYFMSERRPTPLHKTFSRLLIVMPIHLALDGITIWTVNRLDIVPRLLNDTIHRFFVVTMVLIFYLFYQYIAILVEEETGKPRKLDKMAKLFLILAEIAELLLPIHYAITPQGNYSDGILVNVTYFSVGFYMILGIGLLLGNWKQIEVKKRMTISLALIVELSGSMIQSYHPTWLLSGMGLTLMTLAFYLVLENPALLRAELMEQKMSMLYLKSQVNLHFLYNTLGAIRIQAQLNGDKEVADLLMRLVDFFRMSIKVDRPVVEVEDELEMLEAYLDLMCYRYPELEVGIDVEPGLESAQVPNFILQPLVENSLLHGLKNKGYKGMVRILARKLSDRDFEICVEDTGSGFAPGKKEAIDSMLRNYAKQAPKLTGNSIGLLNVQKRIKLLCGEEYGLSYRENEEGGVTARLLLPLTINTSKNQ